MLPPLFAGTSRSRPHRVSEGTHRCNGRTRLVLLDRATNRRSFFEQLGRVCSESCRAPRTNRELSERCTDSYFAPSKLILLSYLNKRIYPIKIAIWSKRWSGRLDLNQRPLDPQSSALPNCATSRHVPARLHAGIYSNTLARRLQVPTGARLLRTYLPSRSARRLAPISRALHCPPNQSRCLRATRH